MAGLDNHLPTPFSPPQVFSTFGQLLCVLGTKGSVDSDFPGHLATGGGMSITTFGHLYVVDKPNTCVAMFRAPNEDSESSELSIPADGSRSIITAVSGLLDDADSRLSVAAREERGPPVQYESVRRTRAHAPAHGPTPLPDVPGPPPARTGAATGSVTSKREIPASRRGRSTSFDLPQAREPSIAGAGSMGNESVYASKEDVGARWSWYDDSVSQRAPPPEEKPPARATSPAFQHLSLTSRERGSSKSPPRGGRKERRATDSADEEEGISHERLSGGYKVRRHLCAFVASF